MVLTRLAVTQVMVICQSERLPGRSDDFGPLRMGEKVDELVVTNASGVTAGDVFDAAIKVWERWRGNEVVWIEVPAAKN